MNVGLKTAGASAPALRFAGPSEAEELDNTIDTLDDSDETKKPEKQKKLALSAFVQRGTSAVATSLADALGFEDPEAAKPKEVAGFLINLVIGALKNEFFPKAEPGDGGFGDELSSFG